MSAEEKRKLRIELLDCYTGQGGNTGRVSFRGYLEELAGNDKSPMQEAAQKYLAANSFTRTIWVK